MGIYSKSQNFFFSIRSEGRTATFYETGFPIILKGNEALWIIRTFLLILSCFKISFHRHLPLATHTSRDNITLFLTFCQAS